MRLGRGVLRASRACFGRRSPSGGVLRFLSSGGPDRGHELHKLVTVLDVFARQGEFDKALNVLERIRLHARDRLSAHHYHFVIGACGRAEPCRWREALGLLDRMKVDGLQPTVVSFNVTMTALARAGRWQEALSLLMEMRLHCNPHSNTTAETIYSVSSFNSAMHACAVGGAYYEAMALLERMRQPGGDAPLPDVASFNIAISACAAAGWWERALDLLEEMRRGPPTDVRPNATTYNWAFYSLLTAPSDLPTRRALVHNLLRQIEKDGVKPTKVTYSRAAAVLSAADDPAALESVRELYLDGVAVGVFELFTPEDRQLRLYRLCSSILQAEVSEFFSQLAAHHAQLAGTGAGSQPVQEDVTIALSFAEDPSFAFTSSQDQRAPPADQLKAALIRHLNTNFDPPLRAWEHARIDSILVVKAACVNAWLRATTEAAKVLGDGAAPVL